MDDISIKRSTTSWKHRGQQRPDFAIQPGPGQESVWDYPRPPIWVPDQRRIQVKLFGVVVADSVLAIRVLETASPPTFYLPPQDTNLALLHAERQQSFCEWKGQADYYRICVANRCVAHAAWSYPSPLPEFQRIANYLAFYPSLMECYVDNERVRPQAGGFYGGWITDEIVGPFKGEVGTTSW